MQIDKKITAGSSLLLDTHVWIWLNSGSSELQPHTIHLLENAAKEGKVFIPAIAVWEIATLAAKKRIILRTPTSEWIHEALAEPGITLLPISPDIMIESAQLPNNMHGDPADRLIVATSRLKRIPLLTRDRKILDYADAGYVEAIKV